MKKIVILIVVLLIVVLVVFYLAFCRDALKFKNSYESLNGKSMENGKKYRNITIAKNNPFVFADLEDINEKIKNKETFIVYFGANWCPWCRSVLPTAIEKAKEKDVEKIYYIDVRKHLEKEDEDIRDIYALDKDKKIYLSHKGTDAYHKFLKYADGVLAEYDSHGVSVKNTKFAGAKRVGAPSFILVKSGKVVKLETGVSEKETDPFMKLNDEIIKDMQTKFDNLFKEYLK